MNSRLHVGQFTNVYHPSLNGVATSVDAFRRGLTGLGHVVYVFAPHASEDHQDLERLIFRYPSFELPLQRYPLAVPVSPFIDLLLPCLKLDVIHAHHPAMLGKVAARKARGLGIPLVFTYHTRYRDYAHYVRGLPESLVKDLLDHWLGLFMSQCHHVIVPSESIRHLLRETYGLQAQISVVSTGVDLKRFGSLDKLAARRCLQIEPEQNLFISAGRLAKEKNWELLLRAFAFAGESAHLIIVGEGEERARLEAYRDELGLGQRVTFWGSVPYHRIPDLFAAADAFCFASVTETQGLVTLEAMASGLPVVAVDGSGTRDAVTDGREGFLTGADHRLLGQRLAQIVLDDDLRRRFGEAARRRAAVFTVEAQAERMEAAYRLAIEDRAAGRRVHIEKAPENSKWKDFLALFSQE